MIDWSEGLFLDQIYQIEAYFNKKEALFIMGKGFDPRSCAAIRKVAPIFKKLDLWLIDYNDRAMQRNRKIEDRSRENAKELDRLCAENDVTIRRLDIPQYEGSDTNRQLVFDVRVRQTIQGKELFKYPEIIVDITAMPRAVAFNLIKRISDIKKNNQKLSILVCENIDCDEKIQPNIVKESARYLTGINTFMMSSEAAQNDTIWLPMLGTGEKDSFGMIVDFLKPIEICPIVPFPSADVSRGERILRFYGEELFRDRGVEARNTIYVPEQYPLLISQKLFDTVKYYEKALNNENEDGEHVYRYAFSSQSSKLMDIGLFLAVMRLLQESITAGIVVVENQGYQFEEVYAESDNKLYCLCLDENEFGWKQSVEDAGNGNDGPVYT